MTIRKTVLKTLTKALFLAFIFGAPTGLAAQPNEDLVALFNDWRTFEQPEMAGGAPDYTATAMARKHQELKAYQARLAAMDMTGWPVEWQVDYQLIRAEMNGMDFNIRVLQSWARDPAFYTTIWTAQSDTPAHEGPTHHGLVELWTYSFPLSDEAEAKLANELAVIPPLLEQARGNLTGNARDLWISGIENIKGQAGALRALQKRVPRAGKKLKRALTQAIEATAGFIIWLEVQAPQALVKKITPGICKTFI